MRFALIPLMIFTSFQLHAAESVGSIAVDMGPTAPIEDPIQKCLDEIRLRRVTRERNHKKEAQAVMGEGVSTPYTFKQVKPEELPKTCPQGNLEAFKNAIKQQVKNCKQKPLKQFAAPMQLGCRKVAREDYCLKTNERMMELANEAKDFASLMVKAKTEFDWFKSDGFIKDQGNFKKGQTQFTGYYGPEPIEARAPTNGECKGDFPVPIYQMPKNMVDLDSEDYKRMKSEERPNCGIDPLTNETRYICLKNGAKHEPVPNRREIDLKGALKNQKLETACVKSLVDLTILMIQGGGELRMRDSSGTPYLTRVHYQGKNGRPRNMIGSILKCHTGKDAGGMAQIAKFLREQPDGGANLMAYDESYVFFNAGPGGHQGVEGIEITPGHSLATDRSIIRTGSVTMFNVKGPNAGPNCEKQTSLAVAQDTGGAIIGAHVDWFQGDGNEAAARADKMNNPGDIFVAAPKREKACD